ncbi:type III restriction enzyme/adenine-specific DNA-methyltransferase [Filimonas lacunae]|uniref:site-specific DNA-methyltransferase (adenine-specific) n=1 Tax=Filimonas lacunae TaxID=477680 RepID=A0A173MNG6_9BACT|nr:site-specific DNA-methyltransferase [Filimonas lacunae]BAV08941.1 type III restriction-modification system methylation subunit [Filimonas lacunae]SIS64392.1 type III restriction enzyme/adenine-specific DNA-methyltransferase [Filimonas lacunae]
MIKDTVQQNENITPNSRQLEILKEHFAACFAVDGSFDMTRFKAEIAKGANVVEEGYELKFLGKSYAKLLASTDTTTIIQPNELHNSLPENANSKNIYISGDNLDGLKHLLKSYNKSIKCIYIDPPYNTGGDGFVYADNFNYTRENLQEKLSVSEEEARRIIDLTKRGSASHSAWLMFMYSRLLLARDLLKNDGVIFISIDDNERSNLKLLCDDVFGEENFVAEFPRITKKAGKTTELIADNNDYLLFYRRTDEVELNKSALEGQGYVHEDEFVEERGAYKLSQTLDYDSIQYSASLDYEIEVNGEVLRPGNATKEQMEERQRRNPKSDSCWRWSKDLFEFGNQNGFVVVKEGKSGKRIYTKTYLNATISKNSNGYFVETVERKKATSTLEFLDNKYSNDNSRKDLARLFDVKVFDYTKPVSLLEKVVSITTSKHDTVLDFFSGSATTAHAVMKLNAEDGGKRKFIMVQLPEVISPEVDAQKIAYEFLRDNHLPATLDYVGMERIKRAAAVIKEERPDNTSDLGFKHYLLAEPNPNTLDKLDSFDKAALLTDTSILDDFGKPAILATWLNADGYGLTVNAQAINLAGYTAYYYQKHVYLIDAGFGLESMKALITKYDIDGHFNPESLVLFGYSFPEWSINEMIEKNLRILNDGERNLKINFTVRY